jgi:hypothetical protein
MDLTNAQRDANGYVAVKYHQNSPHATPKLASGRQYVFVTKAMDICLAWIHPDDVETVLNLTRKGG